MIVDGLSTHRTEEVAKEHGCIVVHERRKGYGYAMQTGPNSLSLYPDQAIVVTADADGTYAVEEIPKLLDPILLGEADLSNGHRQFKNMAFKTRFGNKTISKLANISLRLGIEDTQSGMKALRVELAQRLRSSRKAVLWRS